MLKERKDHILLWDIILIIGVILIVNGVFQTQHAYVTTRVNSDVRKSKKDVVYGAGSGLLGVTNNQIWIETDKRGNMGTAKGVRSGLFRIARAFETDFTGKNIHTFEPDQDIPKHIAMAARMAKRNYLKAEEYDRRKSSKAHNRKTA